MENRQNQWQTLLNTSSSLLSQIQSDSKVVSGAGFRPLKLNEEESKIAASHELYTLLGRHKVDPDLLEKKLARMATQFGDKNKLAKKRKEDENTSDQQLVFTGDNKMGVDDESSKVPFLSGRYSKLSPLEAALGYTVDNVVAAGKKRSANILSMTGRKDQTINDFFKNEIQRGLVSSHEVAKSPAVQKQSANLIAFSDGSGLAARRKVLPPSMNAKSNLFFSGLRAHASERTGFAKELIQDAIKGLKKLKALESLDMWELVEKFAALTADVSSSQAVIPPPGAAGRDKLSESIGILADTFSKFTKGKTFSRQIAQVSLNHLEEEFRLFIVEKEVPSLYSFQSGSDETKILSYMKALKILAKSEDSKVSSELILSELLFQYSESLSGMSEPIDKESGLNIYAIVFYFLRCGRISLLANKAENWRREKIFPRNEVFFLDILQDMIKSASFDSFRISSDYRADSSDILIECQSSNASPWKIALYQMLEGSKIDSSDSGADNMFGSGILFQTIQDYLFQHLFVTCTANISSSLDEIGEMILSCGPSYFNDASDANKFFYPYLLLLCGEFAAAISYMFEGLENDIGMQSEALHLAYILGDSGLLNIGTSPIFELQRNEMNSRINDKYIAVSEDKTKSLMLGKMIRSFVQPLVKVHLEASIIYISYFGKASFKSREYADGKINDELITMLKHLLVETKAVGDVLDGISNSNANIPDIYSAFSSADSELSVEELVTRELFSATQAQGLLYQVGLPGPVVTNVIISGAELALDIGDSLLAFNLLLRANSLLHMSQAIDQILTEMICSNLSSTKDDTKEKKIWENYAAQLLKISADNNSIVSPDKRQVLSALNGLICFMKYLKGADSLIGDEDSLFQALNEMNLLPRNSREQEISNCMTIFYGLNKRIQRSIFGVLLITIRSCAFLLKGYQNSSVPRDCQPLKDLLLGLQGYYLELQIGDTQVAQALSMAQYFLEI